MNRIAACHSKASWEWRTPQRIYAALDREFHFDFDPCPLGGVVDARAPLFSEWRGKRLFCNPPFSESGKFLARAHEAELAVFLIPARTDTKYWHGIVLPQATEIRFIRGRLRFGDATNSAPFPSVVIVFRAGESGPPKVSEFHYKEKEQQ